MRTIGFIHQKGGTGKTTLAIGTAMALAETGARVLLMDADLQGTASEWGTRWGERWRVVVRSQILPVIHDQAGRFGRTFDWMIVDGPPTVSEMTASIIRAAGEIVVPVRPSWPDIWALEHLFALHARLQTEERAGGACVVWNQVVQPPTEAMVDQVKDWPCFVWPRQILWDAVWGTLMAGGQLPRDAGDELRALAGRNGA
ncbi:MAG: ParA family protein [Nitrospira sp. SB0672_bin_25]|nr:ParA family protein [Nitrospira sp. SB0666_bin_27]MYC26464.1 ParA family protein [Nitrospira sp. SB0662_bin_26]MYF24502.1 ParA family protein [Nitrospira sp. SB0678_bin_10]MYJ53659.1 ParA family protein [Nitrospira sp. SB0672_bin_25]